MFVWVAAEIGLYVREMKHRHFLLTVLEDIMIKAYQQQRPLPML
jgi:hypothetical protein